MFRHAQKRVLSVAERSFVSGQKIILSHTQESVLSWTEKSSASTSGRKRDLSWTENSFNMHREKARHGQRKFGHGSCGPPWLLPLEPLIKRVSNTSLLLVKPVLGYHLVGTARRNVRGWKIKQTNKEQEGTIKWRRSHHPSLLSTAISLVRGIWELFSSLK